MLRVCKRRLRGVANPFTIRQAPSKLESASGFAALQKLFTLKLDHWATEKRQLVPYHIWMPPGVLFTPMHKPIMKSPNPLEWLQLLPRDEEKARALNEAIAGPSLEDASLGRGRKQNAGLTVDQMRQFADDKAKSDPEKVEIIPLAPEQAVNRLLDPKNSILDLPSRASDRISTTSSGSNSPAAAAKEGVVHERKFAKPLRIRVDCCAHEGGWIIQRALKSWKENDGVVWIAVVSKTSQVFSVLRTACIAFRIDPANPTLLPNLRIMIGFISELPKLLPPGSVEAIHVHQPLYRKTTKVGNLEGDNVSILTRSMMERLAPLLETGGEMHLVTDLPNVLKETHSLLAPRGPLGRMFEVSEQNPYFDQFYQDPYSQSDEEEDENDDYNPWVEKKKDDEVGAKPPTREYGTLGVRPPEPVYQAPEYRNFQKGYLGPGQRVPLHYGVWTRLAPHLPNSGFRKIKHLKMDDQVSIFGLPPGLDQLPPGMRDTDNVVFKFIINEVNFQFKSLS